MKRINFLITSCRYRKVSEPTVAGRKRRKEACRITRACRHHRHCGVVLGFSRRDEAEQAYRLLLDNRFAAEDVYRIEKASGASKLDT